MVASLDGSISLDGLSGGLSNTADRKVLSTLRVASGCVLVAAGTVQSEGYGTPVSPDLTVAVVTNSGSLDWESPLFQSGQAVVITHRSATLPDEIRSIRAGETSVDLIDAIDQLQTLVPNDGFVQLEGGPTLNASLHQLDLIDAINLTVSPQLIGGAGQRMIESTDEHAYRFRCNTPSPTETVSLRDGFGGLRLLRRSSISRWKSAAPSNSLYTDAKRRYATSSTTRSCSSTATPI